MKTVNNILDTDNFKTTAFSVLIIHKFKSLSSSIVERDQFLVISALKMNPDMTVTGNAKNILKAAARFDSDIPIFN